ncbi:CidA/LrgA family protein [Tepidibacter hydrothermalis]|uniref:CidA/LrgA family protein n=1 Tax=Tepidibacter hydrothermalis TaxID=3036126 RepID=A0ABY8EFD5_9FIRM|nr:CidA/LrgA family protein [Tepidibacter hydrothermalis]WFD11651.1 CidA/LrgA family protein [Tepidibacter hydrothermalis]
MKLFRQLGIVLFICILGEVISNFLSFPLPGSIIGMILLFIFLNTGIIKLSMIEDISKFLLNNLAFFFIPAGVGLISSLDILQGQWFILFFISIISTILVIFTTGFTIQILKRRRD